PSRNEGWDDADLTGSGAAPANTTAGQSYGPDVCWGLRKYEGSPVIGLLGDSIMADYANNNTVNRNFGWSHRALNNAYSFQMMALPNAGTSMAPTVIGQRLRLLEGCDVVLSNLGRNGINTALSTLATVQANFQFIWDYLIRRGLRVWQTTITPYTTSTDGFLTVGNQTPFTGGAADQEQLRVAVNDWIRTVPSPLSGVVDITAQVESAPNSGRWAADGTANFRTVDGIHPSNAGDAALALALNPSIFGPVAQ
ncbi:MAG TPA: GDSL-type esterase/lipase family protein, partial [Acidimicrobiales bacterium]|nr:GDSL-type esterase/lipase family protein [Acidimicrobiales bacterium]